MCRKVDLTYETFPNLEKVRDALKKAAFDEGVGYFDTYAFMGGPGSMRRWVEEVKPPLAGPDYIHFTPSGNLALMSQCLQALAKQGYHVVLGCRNRDKAEAAREKVK
jgi:hypothetical protein